MGSIPFAHMISVQEALDAIQCEVTPRKSELLAADRALDFVLNEDIVSDQDVPQRDQSIVDGYAVRSSDFAIRGLQPEGSVVELEIVEEVTAGQVPTCEVQAGRTVRVMTGVAIPPGADAVVMTEQVDVLDEPGIPLGVARFNTKSVKEGQNVMLRGTSLVRGQRVLVAGTRLRPADIGVIAQMGREEVRVISKTTLAVLPTGDELIDPSFLPGPGKIRNSNGPMLIACGRKLGLDVTDLGIGRDEPEVLQQMIERGLQADVLILSGGVSAGTRDFVPQVLEDLGVRTIFHKVRVKPGKPLWFGKAGNARQTLVFGLPGNPVSSFVCFHLFVNSALKKMGGESLDHASLPTATLTDRFDRVGDRAVYHPAQLFWNSQGPMLKCVRWQGSADLRALSEANALAVFPPSTVAYEAEARVAFLPLD